MLRDPRLDAFCSPASPDVFRSVVHRHELWREDPLDVQLIHRDARIAFDKQLDGATSPENRGAGRILLVKGISGSGKTHLMRAFRSSVHSREAGYFGYMQMSSSTKNYGAYVLSNLIESLDKPYDWTVDERSGLMRLSSALASATDDSGKLCISSEDLQLIREEDMPAEDLHEWLYDYTDRLLEVRRFGDIDGDLIRALLYLQRNDNRIKNRVLRYLRCEDLTARDRKILGDIVPRTREEHPQWIVDQIGRLMWATDGTALVMCLDQFEDLYNLDQMDQKFRSAMSVVCDLAGSISSSVFVISVLADFYEQQKAVLTRSIQDRLENDPTPITLTEGCSLDEIQALVSWRLRHFYDEAGASYDHDQPYYPYTDQELRQLRNMRTRDVLVWCQSRREELIAANGNGEVRAAPQASQPNPQTTSKGFAPIDPDSAAPPPAHVSAAPVSLTPTRPVEQHNAETQRLEAAWNDFRAECDIPAPEADRSMHDLLQWAIKGASIELNSGHRFHAASDGDFIRADISCGDEVLDRLMIKVCNGKVQGARLLKQLRELDAARGTNRPVVLRSTEFPWNNTLKTTKQLAELIADGGRRVVFEDSEWRTLIAFWRFTRTRRTDEHFNLWQSLEKPITQLYAIHAMLDLDDLPIPTRAADVPVPTDPDPTPEPFVPPLKLPEPEPELVVPEVGEIVIGQSVEEPTRPVSFPSTDLARHIGVIGHPKTGVDELLDGLVSQASRSGLRLVVIDYGGLTIGLPTLREFYDAGDNRETPPVRVYVPGSRGEHACAVELLPQRFLQLSATEQSHAVRTAARALGVLLGYNPRLSSAKSCIKILTQAVRVACARDGTAPVERLIKIIESRDPGLVAALGAIKPTLLRDAADDLREVETQLRALSMPAVKALDAADVFDLDILEEGQPAPVTVINTIKLPYPAQHAYVAYRLLADLQRMLSRYESSPLGTLVCVLHADRVLPRTDETSVHNLFNKLLGKCRYGGVGLLVASENGGKLHLESLRGLHQWLTGPLGRPGMTEQAMEIAVKFELPQPTGLEKQYLLTSEWNATHLMLAPRQETTTQEPNESTRSQVPWDLPAAPRRRLTQELPAYVPDEIKVDESPLTFTAELSVSPRESEAVAVAPVVAMAPVVVRAVPKERTAVTETITAQNPSQGGLASFNMEIPYPNGEEKSFTDAASAVQEAHRNEATFKAMTCKDVLEVGRAGAAQLFRLDVGAAVRYNRDWVGATAFKPKDSSRPDAALANPGAQSEWIGDVVEIDQKAGAMYVSAPDAQRLPKPGRFLVSPNQFLYSLHKVYHHEDYKKLRGLIRDRLPAVAGRNGLGRVSAPIHAAVGFEELWSHRWGVLWGPPGTGKTHSIGELVSAALQSENERVLIVSTTNRATDEAAISTAEAMRRRYPGMPLQPLVVRVGRGVGYEPFRERSLMDIVSVAEEDLGRVHQARRRILKAAGAEDRARLRKAFVDQLKQLQDQAVTAFLNPEHRVVVATAHKAVDLVGENALCTLLTKSETPFTTVIVDEASLISRSTAAVISLLAARRVLFVGDPKQLAPISNLSRVLPTRQAYWLGYSALGHVEDAKAEDSGVHLLRTQYRMHPLVRKVISNYQYGDVLQDSEKVTKRKSPLGTLLGNAPRAIWYVLDEVRADDPAIRAERGPGNRSWVRKITPDIVERLLKAYPGLRDQTALLLSPFKAQVKMLNDWIANNDLRDHWNAGTVHAQQGTEADVVIFDTVNAGSHGWSYDDWQRLINVGLSRARELVVFIASRYEMEEPFLKDLRSTLEPRVLVRQGSRWEWHKVDRKLVPAADPQRDGDPALLGNQLRARAALRPIISAQQAQLSGLTMDGKPRLVRGVAGSGKTFVLANWVAKTAEKLRDTAHRRIWVVYANSTLNWLLQKSIRMALRQRQGLSAELRQNGIEIVHVNQVLSTRLRQVGLRIKQNDYDYNDMARRYLEQVPPDRVEPSCDALFIDEAQDMGPETLRLLVALTRQSDPLDVSARSVNIMYDNAQNVYDRGTPRWSELGLDMRGRSTVMKESFRSTRPLNEFALNSLYRLSPSQGDPDHKELVSRELIVEEKRGKRAWWRVNYNRIDGPTPELALHMRRDAELAYLGRRIHELIVSENVRPLDIKFICMGMGKYLQHRLMTELSHRLKEIARVRVQKRQRFDKQVDTIVITTPHSFKGYDSEIVVVPMVDRFVFREEKIFSQALYVAMTRARSYLIVTGTADRNTDLEQKLLTALRTTHEDLQLKVVDEIKYEDVDEEDTAPEEDFASNEDAIYSGKVDVEVAAPQPVSTTDADGHKVIEAEVTEGGIYFGYLTVDAEHYSLFPEGANIINMMLYDDSRIRTSWWSQHGDVWGIDNLKRWFGHQDLEVGDRVKIHVMEPGKLYRIKSTLK